MQAPTTELQHLDAAIERLDFDYGTAVGTGIVAALNAISDHAAAIIVLTDGETNIGLDPLEAARFAAERGVRIFTVGVGTIKGGMLVSEGWSTPVGVDEDALRGIARITQGEYFFAGNATHLKKSTAIRSQG